MMEVTYKSERAGHIIFIVLVKALYIYGMSLNNKRICLGSTWITHEYLFHVVTVMLSIFSGYWDI